ncbi:MAG: DMT family transporter [Candidatus Binatia bacterium]
MAYFQLLGVITLWAGNFPAGKFALTFIGAFTLMAIRTIFGALVLNLLGRKSNPQWWKEIRKDPKSSFIMAFTGVLASGGLFYVGLKLTSSSNAGILAAATPIWVTLLSWMFLGEKLKLVNVTGIVLSFVGLVAIICQGSLANLLQRSFNWGDVILLIGQLNWAVYTVYSRVALAHRSPTAATSSAYLVGAVALLPVFFLEEPFTQEFTFSPTIVVAICYLCVLSPLTNLLYYQALTRISPHRAAVFMNLIPIIVLVFSALFLGERITTVHLIGTSLVISGVVLTTRR